MTYPEDSAYGDKLYGRLMEKWHAMDHCQSSPILIHGLLKEVENWMLGYKERHPRDGVLGQFYDDAQDVEWAGGYNDAISDLIRDLK